MTLIRSSWAKSKLDDCELEGLLGAALRDDALKGVVDKVVLNAKAVHAGTETENRELQEMLWHECRRVALASRPTSVPDDWYELKYQINAYIRKHWLADIEGIESNVKIPRLILWLFLGLPLTILACWLITKSA